MAHSPKLKPGDAIPALSRLGSAGEVAVYLRPNASEADISQMQVAARRDLGEAVPDG